MPMCEHTVPETRRGAGPCAISYEVKLRNGQPNWWCRTHAMAARGPDGNALEACPGAWFKPVPADARLDVDLTTGEYAIWGAIPPAITLGNVPDEPGKVHVHHRESAGSEKDVDSSFDIVTVRYKGRSLVVEGTAAVAFSISELAGRPLTPLKCPRCGELHIDELKFATRAHRKHQCNSCGRNFNDRNPSVGNPLADVHGQLGLPPLPEPVPAGRPLELRSSDHSGVAVWPSNSAIVSTMRRPEESGVHVHAWDASGELVVDETYAPVVLNGVDLDADALRMLAIQRALSHGAPIQSLDCGSCQEPMLSPVEGWIEPTTQHSCSKCGFLNRTRRKTFLNPLAAHFPD